MKTRLRLAALSGATLLYGCAMTPVDAPSALETADTVALPLLLRDRSSLRMEASLTGTLTRQGECLYLAGEGYRALILWGDADVQVARLDTDGWLVNNYTTSVRLREGDAIRGAGGFLPEDADLSQRTDQRIPASCGGQAVQLYDVRRNDPSVPSRVPSPQSPPPPPPAPWRSPLLGDAFAYDSSGFAGPRRIIPATGDPREALFVYVLQDMRADRNHKCLSETDDALRVRLSTDFGPLYAGDECEERKGRIVLKENGEQAVSIYAQTDCSRLGRLGFCAGAAGAIWANLGAQSQGYRLRAKQGGWEIELLGIGAIS